MKKLICTVLAASLLLFAAGCSGVGQELPQDGTTVVKDGAVIGEGETSFAVEVVDLSGAKVAFTVRTDEDTVGEALQALGVLQGEEGPYGLYMKTVNGQTLDYDKDGAYWAFYVNDAYATAGVDETAIVASDIYRLQAEKG